MTGAKMMRAGSDTRRGDGYHPALCAPAMHNLGAGSSLEIKAAAIPSPYEGMTAWKQGNITKPWALLVELRP